MRSGKGAERCSGEDSEEKTWGMWSLWVIGGQAVGGVSTHKLEDSTSTRTSGYEVNRDKLGATFRKGELWRGISRVCSQIGGAGVKSQWFSL